MSSRSRIPEQITRARRKTAGPKGRASPSGPGAGGKRPFESRPPEPPEPLARYDPQLDGLFTYCLSVLRDHDAALAALGDALSVAERRRTRHPRPAERTAWLYALARWSCLRRGGHDGRGDLPARRSAGTGRPSGRAPGRAPMSHGGSSARAARDTASGRADAPASGGTPATDAGPDAAATPGGTSARAASTGTAGPTAASGAVPGGPDGVRRAGEGVHGVPGVPAGSGPASGAAPGAASAPGASSASDGGSASGAPSAACAAAASRAVTVAGAPDTSDAAPVAGTAPTSGAHGEREQQELEQACEQGACERGACEQRECEQRECERGQRERGSCAQEERAELDVLAWPEAAGISARQREVLELVARHRLTAAEVAAVLGMETGAARELIASAACEVERTRTAVAVLRSSRCPSLAALSAVPGPSGLPVPPAPPALSVLTQADHVLTAASRRRLLRHIDECPACRAAAERAAPGTWPGTSVMPVALPLVTAPRGALRDLVGQRRRARPARPRFDRRGYPRSPRDGAARAAHRRRLRLRAVTTAIVATLIATPLLSLWNACHGGSAVCRERTPTFTIKAVKTLPAPDDEGAGAHSGAPSPGPRPRNPPTDHRPGVSPTSDHAPRAQRPGRLTVASRTGRLGTVITLRASGGAPVRWSVRAPGAPWLRVSRPSGTLRPGHTVAVQVRTDRERQPRGRWSARIDVAPASTVLRVTGSGTAPSSHRSAPSADRRDRPAHESPHARHAPSEPAHTGAPSDRRPAPHNRHTSTGARRTSTDPRHSAGPHDSHATTRTETETGTGTGTGIRQEGRDTGAGR